MLREKMNLSLAQIMQIKTIYIFLAKIMQTKNYSYILDGHVVHILRPGGGDEQAG